MNSSVRFISLLILLMIFFSIKAQDRKELEAKRRQTLKEIEYTNSLLKKTRQEKKNSMNQLLILNKKIKAREELIQNIQQEIAILDKRMQQLYAKLDTLESDLKKLKDAYARMLIFAYKTRSAYDKIIFVLSADDFNKSYRRLKYLQYYGEYRQKQIKRIISTKEEIKSVLEQLREKKLQKEQLRNESEQEKKILSQDKEEQTKVLGSLKKQESELLKKLAEQKKADRQLQETIKQLIAEELRKAREEAARKAKEENKAKANITNKPATTAKEESKKPEPLLTPEEQLVNDKFESNRGLLPWPTERGVILSTYGEHEHPVLKGIKVRNDGVQIGTLPSARVRSIFDGEVTKVLSIPGKNKVVIIRHGNYFTVYANLSEVSVVSGQKVKTKQTIGTAGTDPDEDKTFVELQIWNGNIKLNPELWISRMN
ncbi:MAG: peptidoglycan DD-metalloendopeptidase family protein [Bacteroidales bacterium]|nr:peptidoglycan DD-metalloendopeptidase family protein [Bacteroidales bacterium]